MSLPSGDVVCQPACLDCEAADLDASAGAGDKLGKLAIDMSAWTVRSGRIYTAGELLLLLVGAVCTEPGS